MLNQIVIMLLLVSVLLSIGIIQAILLVKKKQTSLTVSRGGRKASLLVSISKKVP